jgi:alpha-ketoglutaric semialdehyde dehydrogenase
MLQSLHCLNCNIDHAKLPEPQINSFSKNKPKEDQMPQVCSNFIDGEWVPAAGGKTFSSYNPANGEEIGQYSASGEREALAAIEAAAVSATTWAGTTPGQRAAILYRAADLMERAGDLLTRLITVEEGKTQAESQIELKRSAASLRYYAAEAYNITGETFPSDEPGSVVSTLREPLGIVTIVTPWNFPLSIPVRKIAPALAAGNTVIFKPSSLTPAVGEFIVRILEEAGLPPGVLNFITGPGGELGNSLAAHRQIKGISFTGSNPAGNALRQAANPACRVQLEMGGKNPLVVMDDADLDLAAQVTVKGAFGLAGQACTGTSRVIVIEAVMEAFMERLIARTEKIKVGFGLEKEVEMGPLASRKQLETVLHYLEIGQQEGAQLVTGGQRLETDGLDQGYFISPAIFTGVTSGMRIAQEEIFGPVLAVMVASDFEEALALANATRYGLSAAICTRSLATAHRFTRLAQAGMVKVNKPTTGVSLNAPFGGMKDSSSETYKEQGRAALEFYTRLKTVDMAL